MSKCCYFSSYSSTIHTISTALWGGQGEKATMEVFRKCTPNDQHRTWHTKGNGGCCLTKINQLQPSSASQTTRDSRQIISPCTKFQIV